MNQMQRPIETSLNCSLGDRIVPIADLELRKFLSETHIATSSGIKNLLGEMKVPAARRATTALITSQGDVLIAGEDRSLEIHRAKAGEPLKLATHRMVTALYESPNSGKIFVGMNQGILAELVGDELKLNKSFLTVSTRKVWHTPWAKNDFDTHSFTTTRDGRIFCAIHVGGVLVSEDDGTTWQPIQNGMDRIFQDQNGNFDISQGAGLNPDVHQIKAHPNRANLLLAATRDGFYVSEDGGVNFEERNSGIVRDPSIGNYQRSLGVFPDREVWLCASAEGPGQVETTRLFRTEDEGRSWQQVRGIPEPAPHVDTIQCFEKGRAIALVGHSVFLSEDYGASWSELAGAPNDYYTDRKHHVVRPI